LPIKIAEIAKRRAGIVVDQNIRLGQAANSAVWPSGVATSLPPDNFGAGRVFKCGGCLGELFRVAGR